MDPRSFSLSAFWSRAGATLYHRARLRAVPVLLHECFFIPTTWCCRCFCYELPAYTGVTQPLCTDMRVTKGYAVRLYDFDNAKQGAWGEREFHSKEVQHAARGILRTFAGPSIGIDKDID